MPSSNSAIVYAHRRSLLRTSTVCVTSVVGASSGFAQTVQSAATDTTSGSAPEQVTVTGVRSLLNDKIGSLQDVPQTVNVVSQEIMKQQAVTRLEDALKNVPGITLNAGEGSARGDTVNLRGFPAFNDFFVDGIRDPGIYTRDSFDLDSVEVLKGPSAILFGRGSTGGVINQVSKAPTLAPLYSGALQLGTNNDLRVTADVDQPLSSTAAIRLNAMDEHSQGRTATGCAIRASASPPRSLSAWGPTRPLSRTMCIRKKTTFPTWAIRY